MSKRSTANTIRIIAGHWRGRRVPVIDREGLRPTTDRVRETLFNWLMHYVRGARCLDLFAGSGALGLECLSRGAEFVEFVEVDQKACAKLRDNLAQLKVSGGQATVTHSDARKYIAQPASERFDLVFLDPPFKSALLAEISNLLELNDWLADAALIYVEQAAQQQHAALPPNWQMIKQGKAGMCDYRLYSRRG